MGNLNIPNNYDLTVGHQSQEELSTVASWYKDLLSRFDPKIYSYNINSQRILEDFKTIRNISIKKSGEQHFIEYTNSGISKSNSKTSG